MLRQICLFGTAALLASVFVAPAFGQWQSNSEGIHYDGGHVGIGTATPNALLDVKGYRTHVVTNSGSNPNPLFTSLGTFNSRYSVWIRATDSGCNLGGSVLYHIAGGWMGLAKPSRRIKVYSLGDNDTFPAVEAHFDVYISKVNGGTYRLGLNHKGGCDGRGKGVRYVVTASHFNSQNTDEAIGNYVKMPVRRYLYQNEDGNVGIGEPSPSKKLEVNGHIRAKEVVVKADGWSDYVFEESYDLPTLEAVSLFIDEEGHLPDVPSAEEVKENGLRLGEMDATLLKKVEELTLYAIEQKERADSLSQQVTRLRKRLKRQVRKNTSQRAQLRQRLETQQGQIDQLVQRMNEQE